MYACAISNAVDKEHFEKREELYMKTVKKYNAQEREVFPQLAAEVVMALEKNPEQDFLGSVYMALNLGNKRAGQFFTPYDVCRLMADISVGDLLSRVKEHGYITINDCACGAGATLIAGIHAARKKLEKEGLNWQRHILVTAQDIDFTTALMCYIQLSLLGCAAYIKIGNSLTDPMTPGDSKENYWYSPMYFIDPWATRRLFAWLTGLTGGKDNGD